MRANFANLRHGLSEANVFDAGKFDYGDPHLVRFGRRQSFMAGKLTTEEGIIVDLIVSGVSARTKETTEDYIRGLGYRPAVTYDARNAEQTWSKGAEGRYKSELLPPKDQIERVGGLDTPLLPGAESIIDVAERVLDMYADYESLDGTIVFVQSAQPAKAVQAVAQGVSRYDYEQVLVPNASLAWIDLNDQGIRTPIFEPPQYKNLH